MSVDQAAARDNGREVGIQRDRLPVYESYEGTGNHTESFPINQREILVANDSTTDDMTVQIIGPASLNTTFRIKPYEVLDERMPEFNQVVIEAVGTWRFWTRCHLLP